METIWKCKKLSNLEEIVNNIHFDSYKLTMPISCHLDKTLFIKEIFNNEHKTILITAPSKFGKTTNLGLLKTFLEIPVDKYGFVDDKEILKNYNFFKKNCLKICEDDNFFKRNFATHIVIDVNLNNYVNYIKNGRFLSEIFERHSYLTGSTKLNETEICRFYKYITYFNIPPTDRSAPTLPETDVIEGLQFLIGCVSKHFDNKKILLLIDNYDMALYRLVIENCLSHYEGLLRNIEVSEISEAYDLLGRIILNTVNSEYVDKAVVTGVQYFDIFGPFEVDSIRKYSALEDNEFRQYFGLTEIELDELLSSIGIGNEKKVKYKQENGGHFSKKGSKLFPIYPILYFLSKNNIYQHLEHEIDLKKMDILAIKYAFGKLYHLKKSVVIKRSEKIDLKDSIELNNIFHQNEYCLQKPDLYLNVILDRGFLTYDLTTDDDNFCKVKLVSYFDKNVKYYHLKCEAVINDYIPIHIRCSDKMQLTECAAIFDQLFPNFDDKILKYFVERFNTHFRYTIEDYPSSISVTKPTEKTYINLMFSILCRTQFLISDKGLTFTNGNPNLIFYRENLGLIVRVTHKQSARTALNQLIENDTNVFEEQSCFKHIKDEIYLGMNINENKELEIDFMLNNADWD